MKIIYIASLTRSGSTFLEFLLAKHKDIISLGEISNVIENYEKPHSFLENNPCSCGKERENCSFWGSVLKEFKNNSTFERHSLILDTFSQKFPNKIVVDSSKNRKNLLNYYINNEKIDNCDIYIIFLVRDFRGWAQSIYNDKKPENELGKGILFNSYRWLYANNKLYRTIKKHNLRTIFLSYEYLVFNAMDTVDKIEDFLNIPHNISSSDLKGSKIHELAGNQKMRWERNKNEIVYNHEWYYDLRPVIAAPFLLPVYLVNKKQLKKGIEIQIQ